MKVRVRRRAEGNARAVAIPVAGADAVPARYADAARAAGFDGRRGAACLIHAPPGRVLLVGVGDPPDAAAARDAGAIAAHHLADARRIAIDATALPPALVAAVAEGAALRAWNPARYRSRSDPEAPALAACDVLAADHDEAARLWNSAEAGVAGVALARNLVLAPGNKLTPRNFAAHLSRLTDAGVRMEVLNAAELRALGMGALLAVGAGSPYAPRLIVLRWPGAFDAPPVAFVGKGITFDTGGICIKPADGMEDMRADMAGAAACAGAILTLALRRSPAPAVAVLAIAENATGAASYRPGDIVRTFPGTTVEVIDTDAEGRLVLADALAYTVARLHPRAIVDLATLTGSVVTALGHHMAGLYANDAALAGRVAAAGGAVGEPCWWMPIGDSHRADLDSDVADLRQCLTGRRQPDACQAAAFLREFVGDTPWAHLDIAGVEDKAEADDTAPRGPTGFGVRLLDRLVAQSFEDPEA
ncbi:MAG: leucyl aminopeptidase [Proteobacteria bacterium]|nr:leucyl aminopeptidase [Pseudomonadota bacterium]